MPVRENNVCQVRQVSEQSVFGSLNRKKGPRHEPILCTLAVKLHTRKVIANHTQSHTTYQLMSNQQQTSHTHRDAHIYEDSECYQHTHHKVRTKPTSALFDLSGGRNIRKNLNRHDGTAAKTYWSDYSSETRLHHSLIVTTLDE